MELELGTYVDGIASMYLYCNAINPPTFTNAENIINKEVNLASSKFFTGYLKNL